MDKKTGITGLSEDFLYVREMGVFSDLYKKEKVVITTTHLNLLLTLKSNTMKKPIQISGFSDKLPNKQEKKCAI